MLYMYIKCVHINMHVTLCVVINDDDDDDELSEDSEGLTGFSLLAKKKARLLHSQVREIGSEVRRSHHITSTCILMLSCVYQCMYVCIYMHTHALMCVSMYVCLYTHVWFHRFVVTKMLQPQPHKCWVSYRRSTSTLRRRLKMQAPMCVWSHSFSLIAYMRMYVLEIVFVRIYDFAFVCNRKCN